MSEPPATGQPSQAAAKTAIQAKRSGCGVAILILLGLTLAGMFGGGLLGYGVSMIPKGPWSRLDLGEEKALRIIGTDDYNNMPFNTRYLYLGTTSGDVYRCWLDNLDEIEKRCNKVTTEQVSTVRYECPSYLGKGPTPSLPGEMIDSLCYPMYHRSNGEDHIAVLRDGSVWEWVTEHGEVPISEEAFYGALAGLVVGFIAGIFAAIFWTVRRKRSQERKV